jgi:pimeloyl-ACP methyl ester carboxylesterase
MGGPSNRSSASDISQEAPDWFTRALSDVGVSRVVSIGNNPIHYLGWSLDRQDLPWLIFVHGYRGHAHWWDFIAPYFAGQYRIAAIDLSGMGDSGYRANYSLETFAHDLAGLISHLSTSAVSVIAHSFGGTVAFAASALSPSLIHHTIAIDTYVSFADSDPLRKVRPMGSPAPRSDYTLARSRYRLLPAQPDPPRYLLNHVAAYSLKRVLDGWAWKSDPNLPGSETPQDGMALLSKVFNLTDFVFGELSVLVDAPRAARIVTSLPNARDPVMICGAHHHVPLDRPRELIGVLQSLLGSKT